MHRSSLVVAALVVSVFAVASGTSAQQSVRSGEASARPTGAEIQLAREQWFEADFEGAVARFVAALGREDLTAAQALEVHRYLATLQLVLSDEAAARAHADAAVALEPSVEAPDGAPPQARDLFLMARRRLGGREATLIVEAPQPWAPGAQGRVVARVEPAPPLLFAEVRLRCGSDAGEAGPPSVEVEVMPPAGATFVECTAEAVTPEGVVLLSARQRFVLGQRGRALSEHGRGRRAWPWILAGSIVAAAAVATTVGLVVSRNRRDPEITGTTVVGW